MKVCSIFSQVLKLFSRGEFEKAVKEHKAELAYANEHRPWQLYQTVFEQTLALHQLLALQQVPAGRDRGRGETGGHRVPLQPAGLRRDDHRGHL